MLVSKSGLYTLAILLFPIAITLKLDYYDEIVVSLLTLLFLFKSNKQIKKNDKIVFCLLIVSYLIGFLSNIESKLIKRVDSVFIDAFVIYKPLLAFLTVRYLIDDDTHIQVIKKLQVWSKLFIIIGSVLAIVSQVVNIGMTATEVRFGIKAFIFLYDTPTVFGILTVMTIIVLSYSNKTGIVYYILGFVSLILTTKGVFYSFLIFSFAIFLFNRRKMIKKRSLIVLALLLVSGSLFQIETYFKDLTSPRMVFFSYSFKIANDYYPLGSGFATYGSEEAKKHYSELYKKYGFNAFWGMSEDENQFLNDNYWAMIIGQLGYIGFILFIIILYLIFNSANSHKYQNPKTRSLVIAALLMIYVTTIATGIVKSSMGVCLFFFLGIVINNGRRVKIYIQK
jgi:hypothetical protein